MRRSRHYPGCPYGDFVSIPVRDSGVLRPASDLQKRTARQVSIPVRDSGVLRQTIPRHLWIAARGFNPCEGFGGFATRSRSTVRKAISCFNPCEGFGGFATSERLLCLPRNRIVSIPVRDSGVLRPTFRCDEVTPKGVSIPVRDSGVLRRVGPVRGRRFGS